jgi:hypothetical protein
LTIYSFRNVLINSTISNQEENPANHTFIFEGVSFENINETLLIRYTAPGISFDNGMYQDITPVTLSIDQGTFTHQHHAFNFPNVTVVQNTQQVLILCDCFALPGKLCEHQVQVLTAIIKRDELSIFFNSMQRLEKLKRAAFDYGLENEPDLDSFFNVEYLDKRINITPALPSLIPVTKESLGALKHLALPAEIIIGNKHADDADQFTCIVLKQHKYYNYLYIELYSAQKTKEGKIKNPLTQVNPLDYIWDTEDHQQLKFYTAVNKFQNHLNSKTSATDISALRAIVKNPFGFDFYYHNSDASEKITASSLVPIKVSTMPHDIKLAVNSQKQFYELSGQLKIDGKVHALKDLAIKFTYFILVDDTLYLIDSLQTLGTIELLKKRPDNLLIHQSKYKELKTHLLSGLEDKVTIAYQHIKPATAGQLKQQGFNAETEKIIYLSDFGSHVMIIPVMRYGEAEIPVRTKRNIFGVDDKGNEFIVKRNDEAELDFTTLLIKQHPYFTEQLENDLHYFYLHKRHFLNEKWFLNVFEEWANQGITVLGFNELEGNKLNPDKINITIRVLSGINWFNTDINIRFGKKKATLKQVHKAVRNKNKYVQLDDGTLGILPLEWIEKFTKYFNSGEILDAETLRISKTNYLTVEELFDQDVLANEVKLELKTYKEKLANFDQIKEVKVPVGLMTSLRPYQQQGLNWLNFLDDFNFGGCLADDMGLGKTIQIIAFILSQRGKAKHNTNILIVPTSLIFNWQQEVLKFAPSIKIHTIYGTDRIKNTESFDQYEIILTSYGTLLADIGFLKTFEFNYVFLDESQYIKNPDSQRYKAVRLLQSRNKIAITGTPIENNTFDLYGQLSFACPGLLGTKQYFKDIYAVPIDKFKVYKRANELQNKIRPFILRRTKQQVATELPERTEMVLYCEMQEQQRKIYDAYEKEFREFISATDGDILKKSPMNVLKGLTKLRQICDSPLLLNGEKPPGDESAKIDTLIEQIEGKSPHHKILVFSQFVSMLDLIKKQLMARNISFSWLTGSTRNREAVVNQFQSDPEIRVFLISMKAGGTGLNLTEADYVYLVDPWWNPAVENQAIDRSHRIGQDKKVVAVRLISPDTIEEKIMQMQDSKKLLADGLIKTDTSFLSSLSKDDLLSLLS